MKVKQLVSGITGIALILSITSAKSQVKNTNAKSRDEKVEIRVKKLDEKLNLTDEQEVKIKGILDQHLATNEQLHEEINKERKAISEEISGVLTKKQQGKFMAMKKQQAEGGDYRENAEAKLEKIKKELNLNAEQTESLRKALTEHLQKLREIKNQAKAEGSRDGMKEKMKTENEQFKTTLKSILTAEQMEKFRNMDKGEGKNRGEVKRKNKKG